jgi:hypothetical protein
MIFLLEGQLLRKRERETFFFGRDILLRKVTSLSEVASAPEKGKKIEVYNLDSSRQWAWIMLGSGIHPFYSVKNRVLYVFPLNQKKVRIRSDKSRYSECQKGNEKLLLLV